MDGKCVNVPAVRSANVMAEVCFTSDHALTEMVLESSHTVLFDNYRHRVDLS